MKPLLKLVAVFFVLAAFAVAFKKFRERTPDKTPFVKLDIEKVISIGLKNAKADLRLVKKENKWQLESPVRYKADEAAVNEFLNKLKNLTVGDVVSESKERHADYGISVTSGTFLEVLSEKAGKPVSLVFGNMAGNYQMLFMKFGSRDEVYTSQGIEKNLLDKDLKLWRDRTVLKFTAHDVDSIKLVKSGGFEITRSSADWVIAGPDLSARKSRPGIDTQKVSDLLNQLKNLETEDFIDDVTSAAVKKSGLDYPALKVLLKFKDKSEKEISFGREEQAKVYTQVRGNPQVFLIFKYKFDSINKKRSEM